MYKLGFIGVGNMGGALLNACAKKIDGRDIIIADYDDKKTAYFAEKYGCVIDTSEEVAARAEYLFIGVKPQFAADTFAQIRPSIVVRQTEPVIISMMAGVTMARICELSGVLHSIIRIMPNVAASVGEAMILCSSLDATDAQLAEFGDFMSEAGKLDFVDEHLIDAGTAVQGCGPAFVCLFIEAMADGAVKCGIPRAKAYEYAIQTLKGTAILLEESGKHPAVVKDEVTSPAGSTIDGVEALEEGGFRHAVMQAVVKAYEKNAKLK